MVRRSAGALGVAVVFVGCGAVKTESQPGRIGGTVHGLWDGADGVALRLEAAGVNVLLTVSANGAFSFDPIVPSGASYTVTIAANPANHSCAMEAGGNGTANGADVTAISVACHGPDVTLVFSGPWGWAFDPTQDMQMFSGSVAAQQVSMTVSGASLSGVKVGTAAAALDHPSEPVALALGSTTVPVTMMARGGLSKTYELVFQRGGAALDQVVYGKASNTQANNVFGYAVALAGDTLAVGAQCESSSAIGIDGAQTNTGASCSGAVYVFIRTGKAWTQQAYIKASNTEANDSFGSAVALSGDTLVVGAPGEDSNATTINGNQADNTANGAGAVYVFVRDGATWSQQAYVKALNAGANDGFGGAVALAGNTLAVGAPGEASVATGINGNPSDNGAAGSGAVYVFVRDGATWKQQAYVKASNTGADDSFGNSVALSGDTLAVGAPGEASSATGIDGNQTNDGAPVSGAAYIFVRAAATWAQQAYIKASNTGAGDFFGGAVALSGDTLAVGAYHESSSSTGIDHDPNNDNASTAGAVYIFARGADAWTQQAYIKASNAEAHDLFGWSVALFGDSLAVGAYHEASSVTGAGHDETNNGTRGAGAVYLFARTGTAWSQQAYVKASNTGNDDLFGWSVALSGDTLAVGAYGEASGAAGINPANGQADNGAANAGAVYLFR